jgi:hypothetical protein
MTHDHFGEIDVFLLQHVQHLQPGLVVHIGVHGDRCTRFAMSRGNSAHHAFHTRCHAGRIDGALEERRAHTGVGDAFGEVFDEHADHRVRHVEQGPRSLKVQVQRHVVVRVDPGGHNDVDVGPLVDPLHAGNIASETDHGGIDDRVDAGLVQGVQLGDRVGDSGVLVPQLRIVLADLLTEHEDVLVHEHAAEVGGVDGSAHGGDFDHGTSQEVDGSSRTSAVRARDQPRNSSRSGNSMAHNETSLTLTLPECREQGNHSKAGG